MNRTKPSANNSCVSERGEDGRLKLLLVLSAAAAEGSPQVVIFFTPYDNLWLN